MTTKERAIKAKAVVKTYQEEYSNLIQKSIDETKIYRDGTKFRRIVEKAQKPQINSISFESIGEEGASAIRIVLSQPAYKDKRIAFLNPASYKNAGSNFLKGLRTPESDLCHNSYLYNVLTAFDKEYYVVNQRKVNKSLYTNSALYTPDVHFFLLDDKTAIEAPLRTNIDIISCSPPNMEAFYNKDSKWNPDLYAKISFDRLSFIRDICELNGIEILIAGSWGLGSMGGRVWNLASNFDKVFCASPVIEKVIFAVDPDFMDGIVYTNFDRIREFHNSKISQ